MPRYRNSSQNTIDDYLISNENNDNKKIDDNIYEIFQRNISVEKIKKLNKYFKKYEKKGIIDYTQYLSCMKKIFDEKNNKDNLSNINNSFDDIYNLLFKRFREVKCVIKKNKEILYITDIKNENYIYTYNILISLCVFLHSDFFIKLKTLFEISDIDEDGLLNKSEIKFLITTINHLFCDEINFIKINSTILSQSLTNIKVKNILDELFIGEGNLDHKNNIYENFNYYVDFKTFYNSVIKIKDYKYKIIPWCINFKESISKKQKNEKIIKIKQKNHKEFMNTYTSFVKEINKNNIYSNRINYNKKKFFKNIKPIILGINDANYAKNYSKTNNYNSTSNIFNNETERGYKYSTSSFECNFSDIKNIEVEPGIIHIIPNKEKNLFQKNNSNIKTVSNISKNNSSMRNVGKRVSSASTQFTSQKNSAFKRNKNQKINFFKLKMNLKKKKILKKNILNTKNSLKQFNNDNINKNNNLIYSFKYRSLEDIMKEIKKQEKFFNHESIKNITKEMVRESKESDAMMKKYKDTFLFRKEKPIKRSSSNLYEYLYYRKKIN